MIPHHQAIAPISMFAEIARELAKTHPIKLEPSHTPLPKYTSIKHQRFGRDYGAAAIHRQRQTILHHQAIAQHSNYQENCLRTWEDTPNQARTFLHTSHNSHSPQLNIAVLEAITDPQPPPNDTQRSFTTRETITVNPPSTDNTK